MMVARYAPEISQRISKIKYDLSPSNGSFTSIGIYRNLTGSLPITADMFVDTLTIAPIASPLGNGYFEAAIDEILMESGWTYFFCFTATAPVNSRAVAKSSFPGNLDGTYNMVRANSVPVLPASEYSTHVFKPLIFDRVILTPTINEANDLLAMLTSSGSGTSSPKKMVALGDSITYGYPPSNYDPPTNPLIPFAKLAADELGMALVNYGVVGSRVANLDGAGGANPMSERYTLMDDDADYIMVMGGTNDFRNGVPLGTISDTTNTTFYGAIRVLCEGLITKYYISQGLGVGANKRIFFCTFIKQNAGGISSTQREFRQAIFDVCADYSIPVLDLFNESSITPHLMRTIPGSGGGTYNPLITDGTHPTQAGHRHLANRLVGFLRTI